jgi:hypothetical protein
LTIFLEEDSALGLERQLKNAGLRTEHVITIGWRGAPDARIRTRLVESNLLFLTQEDGILFSKGPLAGILDNGQLVAWAESSPNVWTRQARKSEPAVPMT